MGKVYKTEWWYEWPETYDGKYHLALGVDEDSTAEELEEEIDYWARELAVYDPPEPHRKAILQAIKWMTMILGTK